MIVMLTAVRGFDGGLGIWISAWAKNERTMSRGSGSVSISPRGYRSSRRTRCWYWWWCWWWWKILLQWLLAGKGSAVVVVVVVVSAH
jgi:hypothetical protein